MIKIDKNKTSNIITLTIDENATLEPTIGTTVTRFLRLYNKGNSNELTAKVDLSALTDLSTNTSRYNQYEIDGTLLEVETIGELNYEVIEEIDDTIETLTIVLEVGLAQIEDSSMETPITKFNKTKEEIIYFK